MDFSFSRSSRVTGALVGRSRCLTGSSHDLTAGGVYTNTWTACIILYVYVRVLCDSMASRTAKARSLFSGLFKFCRCHGVCLASAFYTHAPIARSASQSCASAYRVNLKFAAFLFKIM